ncbi:xanthine dehydrogenase family protein molybdopterin-binding subunit [Caldimonas brevitalea]|uniref:Acylaldehyde oxidase n=1 Tax=Caldimonas brevitalea TaxID=413882 RepID=A0A0G3BZ76_9BURK|nr:xanthine dehydrogenase family protein molybdopterin-binding subunit [Caldimonas brevitalea]AKJ31795.1 acylaldehyde oxidase [Caldimonas brevitalea]
MSAGREQEQGAGERAALVGRPVDRVDGPLKVCGQAKYVADVAVPGLVHATMVLSTVSRARVRRIDTTAATALPGVLCVMTHENAPRLPEGGRAAIKPPAGRTLALLQDDQVHYDRQPIAVVVAESLEVSRHAARLLQVDYEPLETALDFEAGKVGAHPPKEAQGQTPDSVRGDVAPHWNAAAHRVEAVYTTPTEHHNPLETHATLAQWHGERLTLHDSTQYVYGVQTSVAKTLGIAPEQVQVINPYVGGAFGSKGSTWSHVVLCAMAARAVGRPVRLVVERPQMFGPVGNRPRTEQHLRLASDTAGHLTAVQHDVWAETSRIEDWLETSALLTRMLYSCENVATSHRLVGLDIPVPTFQRAPGESTGSFALESALDELAVAAGVDPLAMRLLNHADRDEHKQLPFSSKSLRACYEQGAAAFGWSRRDPRPARQRDGDWQVGYGMGTATYPSKRMAAEASACWRPDGSVLVRCATHDLGTGTYTALSQVAADTLGLPLRCVQVEIGDSALPQAPVSGGSMTIASVAPAVQDACRAALARLVELALGDAASPLYQVPHERVQCVGGRLCRRDDPAQGESVAALLARHPGQRVEARARSQPGAEARAYSRHAFGAVFAEVRVDRDLGEIRVPRLVGAFAVGRLLNEKTGRSQLLGGMVWGVSMALHEHTLRDPRYGRVVNANLAEYHVPVNADIGKIELIVVPEDDPHVNPLGAKGVGEIGITGVVGAIANAVYHATGQRVRELPITLDRLI